MKKDKIIKIVTILLIIIFSIGLIYSSYNIINWFIDNKKTDEQIENILNVVDIIDSEDNENTEIIANSEVKEEDLYWDYIKMNLIDVDFDELENKNRDVVGWIQVNGTNVNYPFVQSNNNTYYLDHSFDKTFNYAGWIFMDYRNNYNLDNKNTIIYGHSRLDNAMFGSLRDIATNGWLDNSDNFVIKTSTKYENDLWQVFSIYRIPTTSDYLVTDFNSDEDFLKYIDLVMGRSSYNFNTSVSSEDKIITLSTCYKTSDERVVIHAKLIKKEVK